MLSVRAAGPLSADEMKRRNRRWHSFQVVFGLAYAGILLDIVTTVMGYAKDGSSYEQNPLGASLISGIGWGELFLVMTAIAVLCYVSCRIVYFHASLRIATILTGLLAFGALVRWTAAVTAVLYIVQGH